MIIELGGERVRLAEGVKAPQVAGVGFQCVRRRRCLGELGGGAGELG